MGILRMGMAALAVGGMVMVAERSNEAPTAAVAPAADAAGHVVTFCKTQPELCVAAAGAGLAALKPAEAAPPVAAPPASTAAPAPTPRLTTASIAAPSQPARQALPRPMPARVPLPPRRPDASR